MYPARSVLMGEGTQDAWFTVGAPQAPIRALVETSGATIIQDLQSGLRDALSRYAAALPPNVVAPQSGRWDGATARAVLLLADRTDIVKNAYDGDYIVSAWGEYYKRHWDVRLTSLALAIMANLRHRDVWPEVIYGPDIDQPITMTVEISHDARLPRWDTAPRDLGFAEYITRRICNGSLDNCA